MGLARWPGAHLCAFRRLVLPALPRSQHDVRQALPTLASVSSTACRLARVQHPPVTWSILDQALA